MFTLHFYKIDNIFGKKPKVYMNKLIFILSLIISFHCFAENSWVVQGHFNSSQNDYVDNPSENVIAYVSQPFSLPYQVPEGYNLHLTSYKINSSDGKKYKITPWVGTPPFEIAKSIYSSSFTNFTSNSCCHKYSNCILSPGNILNVRVSSLSNENIPSSLEWYLEGYLQKIKGE